MKNEFKRTRHTWAKIWKATDGLTFEETEKGFQEIIILGNTWTYNGGYYKTVEAAHKVARTGHDKFMRDKVRFE